MPAITGSQRFVTQARAGIMRAGASRAAAVRAVVVVERGISSLYIDKSRSSVRLSEGQEPSTATLVVPDRGDVWTYAQPGQSIAVRVGGASGDPIFSGQILSARRDQSRVDERPTLTFECADWRAALNDRIVRGRFTSTDARSVLQTLINSWAPNIITWDLSKVESLGVVDEISFTNETLLQAFDSVIDAAGGRWYMGASPDPAQPIAFVTSQSSVTSAHHLRDADAHFWGFEYHEDYSQIRTRCYVEGAGVTASTRLPVGARAMPCEAVPSWWTVIPDVNSLTSMRVDHQILSSPLFLSESDRQGVVTTSVSANAAPNANSLSVVALSNHMLNAPNWVRVNENWVYHTNRDIPSNTIYGIPTSGPGSLVASVTSGAPVYQPSVLTWTNSLTTEVSEGASTNIWVTRDNNAARSVVSTREGGAGLKESFVQDRRLGLAGCFERGDAEVSFFGLPEYRGSYSTRDPNATLGRHIIINITSPAAISSVTARIVAVDIASFEDSYTGYTYPVRRVTFTSHRYKDVFQLMRKLEQAGS